MKIFISHSSRDAEITKALVRLLQKSMRLSNKDILCSSVDGYKLPAGASTDETLRIEVHGADLLIGLLTPGSLRSLYVSFELGARWGINKPMIPLLSSGATVNHLEGPLAGINALSCDNESHVNQLVEDAARYLSIIPENTSGLIEEVKNLIDISSVEKDVTDDTDEPGINDLLSPKEQALLLYASEDKSGAITHLKLQGGEIVSVGGQQLNDASSKRDAAEWVTAIKRLEDLGLVEDDSGNRNYYELTGDGYAAADLVRGQDEGNES